MFNLNELYLKRDLLAMLVRKELMLKYQGSVIGIFWSVLNPILFIVIYTFAFKYVLRIEVENYPIFLMSGLIPWMFFNTASSIAMNSLRMNSNIIKKVYLPREIFPMSLVLSQGTVLIMNLMVLLIAMPMFGMKLKLVVLMVPLLIFELLVFTYGFSLVISITSTIFQDVRHIVEVMFTAWFYVTPVIYPLSMVPDRIRFLLYLNPLTSFVNSFRSVFYYGELPTMLDVFSSLLWMIISVVIGYLIFRKYEWQIAEEL